MKPYIYTLLFLALGCKKEYRPQFAANHQVQQILSQLSENTKGQVDVTNVVRYEGDGGTYYRIGWKGQDLRSKFVLAFVNRDGAWKTGKVIEIGGRIVINGTVSISFEGNINIFSLHDSLELASEIRGGYITRWHEGTGARTMLMAASMPEIIVTTTVSTSGLPLGLSDWVALNTLLGSGASTVTNASSGSTNTISYGQLSPTGNYQGTGTSSGSGGGGEIMANPLLSVDMETYVDNPAIDILQFVKCFENIPDNGAICSIELCADIPVDGDPYRLFNWSTRAVGHTFIQIKKRNGDQSVLQNIGLYPTANWKAIVNADPIPGKFVDDGHHEFNASIKMDLTPYQLKGILARIKTLAAAPIYDVDQYNCTDFALDIFNYTRVPLEIPKYVLPGGTNATNTPQGIYVRLKEIKESGTVEAKNIDIDFTKAYVASSTGPCN